jgi:(+)-trans-carveol dehydrogenase
MGRVDGKVALITGGARGQGRSHAVTLAREGADIAVIDICAPIPEVLPYEAAGESDLQETVRLVEDLGRRAVGIKADVRNSQEMTAAVHQVISELGRIDILSVNHGVVAFRPWDEQSDDVWDAVIDINLTGGWRAAKAVAPHMVYQRGGSIIFTASTAGLRAYTELSAYVASKAGVIGLMKALSAELAPHSIRVNAVLPANCATPMLHGQALIDQFVGHEQATLEEMEFPSQAMGLLPIPWVEPEDVSKAVLFLGSDESRYVTGISLPVDGGTLGQPPGIPPSAAKRLDRLEYAAASQS